MAEQGGGREAKSIGGGMMKIIVSIIVVIPRPPLPHRLRLTPWIT